MGPDFPASATGASGRTRRAFLIRRRKEEGGRRKAGGRRQKAEGRRQRTLTAPLLQPLQAVPTAHQMPTAYRLPPSACCLRPPAFRLLSTAFCIPPTAFCISAYSCSFELVQKSS